MTASVFTMGADQFVPCTLKFVDDFGNEGTAPVGVPAWVSADENIVTVAAAEDGMSAIVTATGNDGVAMITVTLGELSGTLEVTIVAGLVTSIMVVPGAPAPKPPVA